MEHYLIKEATLTDIANSIRTQRGLSTPLNPAQMPGEILELVDTSDATASSDDLLLGTTAYVNKKKVTGSTITVRIVPNRAGIVYYYDGTEFVKESLTSGTTLSIKVQKGSGFVITATGNRNIQYTSTGSRYSYYCPNVTVSNGSRTLNYYSFSYSNVTNYYYTFLIRVTENNATVTLNTASSLVTT